MRRARPFIERFETRRLFAGIIGTVFEDRNNDTAYASPDLGVTTTVYIDSNDNSVLDAGESSAQTGTMTSGQWGRYGFVGLGVGTYHLRAVLPTDFAQTYPLNNASLTVTITNASFNTLGANIGLRNVTQSSRLAGRAYSDTNHNGTRDGEAYLANVTVYNDKDDDGKLDAGEETAVTDSTGLFQLNVLNPNYTTTFHVRAVAPAGLTQTTLAASNGAWVYTIDAGNATLPSDQFGFADLTPPQVTSATIELDARPHVIRFNLSEPLGQIPFTLSLTFSVKRTADLNGPSNVTSPPGAFTLSTTTPSVLRYSANTSSFPDGLLPDGVYLATIPANSMKDAAGNTNSSAYTFEFHVLRGDFNGDRKIDFADLVILSQNYGQSGRTFAQGNANFSADGAVGFDDLVLVAQHYNGTLPPPTPSFSPLVVAPASPLDDALPGEKRRRRIG